MDLYCPRLHDEYVDLPEPPAEAHGARKHPRLVALLREQQQHEAKRAVADAQRQISILERLPPPLVHRFAA